MGTSYGTLMRSSKPEDLQWHNAFTRTMDLVGNLPVFQTCPFSVPGSNLGSHMPLLVFNLWQTFSFSWTWHFGGRRSGMLSNVLQFGFVCCFLMIRLRLRIWTRRPQSDVVASVLIRGYMTSVFLIPDDVNLDLQSPCPITPWFKLFLCRERVKYKHRIFGRMRRPASSVLWADLIPKMCFVNVNTFWVPRQA